MATYNGSVVTAQGTKTWDENSGPANEDATGNLLTSSAAASVTGNTAATSTLTYPTASWPLAASAYWPTSKGDADGGCAAFQYDTVGNVTDARSGQTGTTCGTTGGDRTTYHYQGGSKPGGGTWACGGRSGQVCAVTDPVGSSTPAVLDRTTSYAYDTGGNLTGVTPPAPLGATSIVPDGLSRTSSVTDGKAQVTSYTYDAYDRVTKVTFAGDTTCSSTATCTTYTYDANGNLTGRTDASGTTTITYDRRNRPTTKASPGTFGNACSGFTQMRFAYDASGNLTSVCDGGGTVAYGYDAANQLASVQEPGGNCSATPVTGACTRFDYTDGAPGGRYYDGAIGSISFPPGTGVVTTFGYNAAGQQTSVLSKKGASTLTSFTYTYTNGTNDTTLRRTMTTPSGTTTYQYDANNQLCWAASGTPTLTACNAAPTGASAWTYDLVGNRKSQTAAGVTTSTTPRTSRPPASRPDGYSDLTRSW